MASERIGLTLPIDGLPPSATIVELAKLAEASGFTDIWSAEVGGTDGLTPLAAIAAVTDKLRLGTAIVPAASRPPALLAMSAASLQAISGGRFNLGIGTSTTIIVEGWMGQSFDKPLTRVRQTVEAVKEALSGSKLNYEGHSFETKGFRLTAPPPEPVPIYIAALGPKMLHLAGEIADGVILYLFTPEGVAEALAEVREGAEAAGRDFEEIDVVIRVGLALDEEDEVLRFMLRRATTPYAMVDVYNRSLARQGFTSEAEQIAKLWKEGDRDGANEAVSDEMLEGLYIFGDEKACRTRLDEFRYAGVKTPVLFPISVEGDPDQRLKRIRTLIEIFGAS